MKRLGRRLIEMEEIRKERARSDGQGKKVFQGRDDLAVYGTTKNVGCTDVYSNNVCKSQTMERT